jgi:ABC-type sugar transport system substrate-binding protein
MMPKESYKPDQSTAKRSSQSWRLGKLIRQLRSLPEIVKYFFLFATTVGALLGLKEPLEKLVPLAIFLQFVREHGEEVAYAEFVLIVLLLVAMLLCLKAFYDQRAQQAKKGEQDAKHPMVLFIAPELGGFYAEYLTALVHAAREKADTRLEISITPYVSSIAQQQQFSPEHEIEAIVQKMPWVSGVFLIPKSPHTPNSLKLIQNFHLKHAQKPLVTLDVYPHHEALEGYPHFVGGNETRGGQIAAIRAMNELSALLETFTEQEVTFRVLVLVGANSAWEAQRQNSFVARLNKQHERLQAEHSGRRLRLVITRSPPLEYLLDRACSYLSNWAEQEDDQHQPLLPPHHYHVIFACNDEMALGAAKAVRGLAPKSGTKIIGYDGTSRMKLVLQLGNEPMIKGTVCVSLQEQAHAAVNAMSKLFLGEEAERFKKISPQGWPPRGG